MPQPAVSEENAMKGQSFRDLLEQLASVNETQEREILRLKMEVASLSANLVPSSQAEESEELEEEVPQDALINWSEGEAISPAVGRAPERSCLKKGAKQVGGVADLGLRDVWQSQLMRATRIVEEKREEALRVAHKHHASVYMEETKGDQNSYRWILRPNDPIRVSWDLVGMILLFYDICTIPLAAFDPDPHWFTTTMDWTTQIFWTCDIFMSLISGYVHEGAIIVTPLKILKNYLRTWFVLDLAVCGPDWISTFVEILSAEQTQDPTDFNRLLRSLRVVRTVRLLRLVKLKRILATIKDRITSEAVFILLNICKLIFLLLLVNHFIAAAWYLIGTGVETNNWLDVYQMHKGQESLGYRYGTSLHWSLTQFTPASMEVHPQNVWERYFSILVLIAGLVLFSSFISSITGSMSQLRNMKADKSKQFWLLRRYLKQQRVPRDLCFRVLRYIEYAMNNVDERVPEGRINILHSLTEQLRNELRFFTHFRNLTSHPMFAHIRKLSEAILNWMSGSVLQGTELAAGDPLFSLVDVSSEMFFIQKGTIRYTLARRDLPYDGKVLGRDSFVSRQSFQSIPLYDETVVLEKENYLCEVALWCPWVHLGMAQAVAEASVIRVEVIGFCDLITKDQELGDVVTLYARRFVEKFGAEPTQWIEVSNEEATALSRGFFVGPHAV